MKYWKIWALLLVCPLFLFALSREEEIELGKQAAQEVEKEYKLYNDKDVLDKVNKIGKDIASVSDDPNLPYTFKVVVSEEVNAFTLPGGFVYITTGLLSFVRTDDELAGVLAHEIAHASRHHFLKLLEEQAKTEKKLAPFLLAAILGAKGSDFENIYLGLELIKIAKMHDYGQKLEEEADIMGATYLIRTKKYNPVGLLTFMERLARIEERGIKPELGILQTHPYSKERATALLGFLKNASIEINRRRAEGLYKITMERSSEIYDILIDGELIARLKGEEGKRRGEEFVDKLDRLLDNGLRFWEISVRTLPNGNPSIWARNENLLEVSPDILPEKGMDPYAFCKSIVGNIRHLLFKGFLDEIY